MSNSWDPVRVGSSTARFTREIPLLVDEYQDTDPAQQRLLDAWLGANRSVCVVGDPRQTIYSFKGAEPSLRTQFSTRYPDAVTVSLVRDYRSGPQIVDVANRIMTNTSATAVPMTNSSASARPAPSQKSHAACHRGRGSRPPRTTDRHPDRPGHRTDRDRGAGPVQHPDGGPDRRPVRPRDPQFVRGRGLLRPPRDRGRARFPGPDRSHTTRSGHPCRAGRGRHRRRIRRPRPG